MEKSLKIISKIENLRKVEKLVDELSSEFNISADVYGNFLLLHWKPLIMQFYMEISLMKINM